MWIELHILEQWIYMAQRPFKKSMHEDPVSNYGIQWFTDYIERQGDKYLSQEADAGDICLCSFILCRRNIWTLKKETKKDCLRLRCVATRQLAVRWQDQRTIAYISGVTRWCIKKKHCLIQQFLKDEGPAIWPRMQDARGSASQDTDAEVGWRESATRKTTTKLNCQSATIYFNLLRYLQSIEWSSQYSLATVKDGIRYRMNRPGDGDTSVKSRLPFGRRLVGQTDTLFIMRLLRRWHRGGGASAGVLSCESVPVVCGTPNRPRNSRREPITRWTRGAIDRHSASWSVTSNSSFFVFSAIVRASRRHSNFTLFRVLSNLTQKIKIPLYQRRFYCRRSWNVHVYK